jgi:hypothetical protein
MGFFRLVLRGEPNEPTKTGICFPIKEPTSSVKKREDPFQVQRKHPSFIHKTSICNLIAIIAFLNIRGIFKQL